MTDLMKYFKILFLTSYISRANLKQFTEDHIQRLTANNPGGIFTTLIAHVTNAYTAFFGNLGDVSVAEAPVALRKVLVAERNRGQAGRNGTISD